MDEPVREIAVIGSGISGLSAAWLLGTRHRVTLYEAASRPGGHSHTVNVPDRAGAIPVDMGFIVYNEPNYPNLDALFRHLGVPTRPAEMSFAVSLEGGSYEYSGGSLAGLLAQKRNLLRPRFWSMLRDLARLYREAPSVVAGNGPDGSLGAWLDASGYGDALQRDHLLPMAAAIWSCPTGAVRDHPAAAFLRFCETHGLLRLRNRPVWRTVSGGSRRYVDRLLEEFAGTLLLGAPVRAVRRPPGSVELNDGTGWRRFDAVVLATHAPQALALLADADPRERALLGACRTTSNAAVLHRDAALMPRRRRAWSSWNLLATEPGAPPTVTYWMNRLQGLASPHPLLVTLNPHRAPAPGSVLAREEFAHPLMDRASRDAVAALWGMQGARRTWFCGAWLGSGFHEDGLQSGLAVAEALGDVRRPWQVANESGRLPVPAIAG